MVREKKENNGTSDQYHQKANKNRVFKKESIYLLTYLYPKALKKPLHFSVTKSSLRFVSELSSLKHELKKYDADQKH